MNQVVGTIVVSALGFVVARDRLFQLELQARAGAGTCRNTLEERHT